MTFHGEDFSFARAGAGAWKKEYRGGSLIFGASALSRCQFRRRLLLFCSSRWSAGGRRCEIHRVAKPGGIIYVNANAIGYYANLWLNRPNEAEGYDARMLVADAFVQTLEYERTGKFRGGCLMIDEEDLLSFLAGLGFEQIMSGGEGTLRLGAGNACPSPFFDSQYYGLPECMRSLHESHFFREPAE